MQETDSLSVISYSHAKSYSAKFIGSDYNYATQQEFRFKFRELTQDKELLDIGYNADKNESERASNINNQARPNPMQNDLAFGAFMTTL